MAKQKNTIKLNGKEYDAKTGAPVGHASTAISPIQHQKAATAEHRPTPVAVLAKVEKKTAHVSTSMHSVRSASAVHKRKQRASTLMRATVKRPQKVQNSPLSTPLDASTSVRVIEPEPLMQSGVQEKRDQRMKSVKKSKLITRFGTFASGPSFITRTEAISVQPAPIEHASSLGKHAVKTETSPDFSNAIHQATSHTEPVHKRAKRSHRAAKKLGISPRAFNAGAASLAIVLLVGFFAYQNQAGTEFRTAASRAGIHASLPGYSPPGFAVNGPVQYEPGEVTVRFQANSDGRNYSLSQQATNWNNDSLAANLETTAQRDYNPVQDGNRTVYIDNNSNAAWVKNGMLYQINSDSTLSTDQLLKIANSL